MNNRMHNNDKSSNFKRDIFRLFKELIMKNLVIISLILAIVSSILSIVSPNKLSDLTDEISAGLIPNISEDIITDIMMSEEISAEDKMSFQNIITSLEEDVDTTKLYESMDLLPNSIYEIVKPRMDLEKIKSIGITIIIIYLLSALFSFLQSLIMATVSNRFAQYLRNRIDEKINKLPLKYFDKHQSGDTLSIVTNDVDMIASSMNHSLASLVSSVTLFVGTIIMMFVTNWIMAITAIVSSLIGFGGMAFILSKSQKYFSQRQKELGNLNGHIEEMYSNLNVMKLYNGKEESDIKFDELNNKVAISNKKSQFFSGIMQPLMSFVGNFGYVMVCIVGALLTMSDMTTFGVIVAFILYVRLFTSPLSQIAQAMTQLQSTAAASERVFDLLDEEEMSSQANIKKKIDLSKIKGQIEFRDVSFKYDGCEDLTIKNFSAKVLSGQNIAIVGPTGAGKTTMVNLLMKFYDITSGEILIDGISTSELTRENVHDLFNMVLQDTWMFNGTIRENIIYNQDNVSDLEVERVCKEIGLEHFIKTLPEGYDTVLGENNAISGGQRQLLTIARAMIKNAPFLILDEATSNVDTRTEKIVQRAMDKLTEGRTSFIIAHRLSTIRNADLILVMREGNIVEHGNHDELMKVNGFYANLYNSQFDELDEN